MMNKDHLFIRVLPSFQNALKINHRMNYRDASIRGIGDFACGDQLTQLDRGRTDSPARSIFAMQSIAV